MPKVNQQLIADKLKLSRATVSRCFTNHPWIDPETRARVFDLASRLGYTHRETRHAANQPARRTRLAFGVLICIEHSDFNTFSPGSGVLAGLSEMARAKDVRLDLHFVRPRDLHLDSPSYRKIFEQRKRRHDGLILIYPFPATIVNELRERYPVVSLVEQYGARPLDSVDVDNHGGIAKVVDRLYALGHRRIGFLTWRYAVEAGWPLRRYSGFMERAAALGLDVQPEDLINVSARDHLDYAELHAHAVARTRGGVTAWICAADHQAQHLVQALQAQGLRVPEDVSVTGFDALPAENGEPILTSVQVPFRQIGIMGGERLLDLIARRYTVAQHILLDCELREGATTGPPRR